MAISSAEYKSLILNCLSVIPDLRMRLPSEDYIFTVIDQIDEIRSKQKTIKTEWLAFRNYPRHDTSKLKEAISLMLELCEKFGIDPTFPFPNNIDLNEGNWEDFRKTEYIARYFYKGVEITGIIEF